MTVFDVILIPFPFSDLSAVKRRPCLVLSSFRPRSLREHLVLAMMTSQVSTSRFPHDVEIDHLKPTLVRLSKLVTLDSQLIVKTLGTLHARDRDKIRSEFGRLFKAVL
jgi:mRNA interferase MazF